MDILVHKHIFFLITALNAEETVFIATSEFILELEKNKVASIF